MSDNLNQNLYSRFGLLLNLKKVQDGFQAHLKNVMLEYLQPIIHPSMYKEPSDLYKAQREVLKESCRQLFIDFDGVLTFSPSWGDEFLTPLLNTYGERLILKNTSNPSVQATLDILQETIGKNFLKN